MTPDPYFNYRDEPPGEFPAARVVCRVDLIETTEEGATRITPLPGVVMQPIGQTAWRAALDDGSLGFQRWPAKNDAAYDLLNAEQKTLPIRGVSRR